MPSDRRPPRRFRREAYSGIRSGNSFNRPMKRGTKRFAPGQTRRTVAVPVLRDEEAEDAETVVPQPARALALRDRYDAGAAETGAGLVLSGRLSYVLPAWGLTLSGGGEGLLVRQEEGFRDWGAGGSLHFDPGAPGRGLALKVEPTWGAAVPRAPRRRAELRPGRARRGRRAHPLRRRGAGRRRRAHLAPGQPPAPRLRPRRQPGGHPRRAGLRHRPARPRRHPELVTVRSRRV